MTKATLEKEENIISSLKELPLEEQKEVTDFIEFLKQKRQKKKSDIKKILALEGALKDDEGLEERMKNIRKELNKWRNIESV